MTANCITPMTRKEKMQHKQLHSLAVQFKFTKIRMFEIFCDTGSQEAQGSLGLPIQLSMTLNF